MTLTKLAKELLYGTDKDTLETRWSLLRDGMISNNWDLLGTIDSPVWMYLIISKSLFISMAGEKEKPKLSTDHMNMLLFQSGREQSQASELRKTRNMLNQH